MRKILLADDQEDLRLLLQATLEDNGYELLEASNGPEALALARAEHPALMVMDWMMPGMTGLEVLRNLKASPDTSPIPVILLTARKQPEDREAVLSAGASVYLAKPFSPLELVDHVERLLGAESA